MKFRILILLSLFWGLAIAADSGSPRAGETKKPNDDYYIGGSTGVKFADLARHHPFYKVDRLHGKEREKYLEYMRESGLLSPKDEGLLGEAWKGFARSSIGTLRGIGIAVEKLELGSGMKDYFSSVLRHNQQWRAPEDPSVAGYVGGAIGVVLGYTWPVVLILLVLWFRHIRPKVCRQWKAMNAARKERREIRHNTAGIALEELENGTPDKATWAEAIMQANGDEQKARAFYIKLRVKNYSAPPDPEETTKKE